MLHLFVQVPLFWCEMDVQCTSTYSFIPLVAQVSSCVCVLCDPNFCASLYWIQTGVQEKGDKVPMNPT